ncbi:H-NS family nucleoid-associated regulatory protein [Chromobacterium violaceum]
MDRQRDVSQTGRGRKPLWVQELLDQGKTLEEITI